MNERGHEETAIDTVVIDMKVISFPCMRDQQRHEACPVEVILSLWAVAIECGCDCHS